ncbi:MAG: site-specific integrase [Burkholderiaceae bacterium]|nr:site-specific integrase [Burkholderiaceae bacterium]
MPASANQDAPALVDDPDATRRSLADVLAWIETEPAIAERDRRAFRGAARTVCSILGAPPASVPADAADVERRLAAVPKPARGRSDKTVANARWRLKRAIALGVDAVAAPTRGAALTPRWAALRERLDIPRLRNGLSRLIREASASGVEPEGVTVAFVEAIAARVAATRGEARGRAFRRQAIACWNEAVGSVAGWPSTTLAAPAPTARPGRLPVEAFPISFGRDLDSYLAWAAHSGRLARNGSPRSLSPATVRLRGEHLRLAASALARRLGYARRVINLATLVEPVNFKLVLAEYLEAGPERRPSAFVQGLAGTLFGVARQWVKAPASQLDQLGQFKRRLGSRPAGFADRNRRAIEPFADPKVLAALLALPQRLFAQASGGRSLDGRAVRQAQVGVAIALLLSVPLRLRELAGLELGRGLLRPSGRQGSMSVVPGRGAGGASHATACPIVGPTKALIDDYLDGCHARLPPSARHRLFVRPDGEPVPDAALRYGIATQTRRAIGVALTPGQFRHLAAMLVLRERPGELGLVSSLLGHSDPRTTANLYAGIGVRGAAAAYATLLDRARPADEAQRVPGPGNGVPGSR